MNILKSLHPSADGRHPFISGMVRREAKARAKKESWISGLRSQGIVAAHPVNGHVDSRAGSLRLWDAHFDDGVTEGSRIALGDAPRRPRIVRVTRVEQSPGLIPGRRTPDTIHFQPA